MGQVRLGVDIGGTFTDITVLEEDTGRISIAKVPSRHDDPAGALIAAVEQGIAQAGVGRAGIDATRVGAGIRIVATARQERGDQGHCAKRSHLQGMLRRLEMNGWRIRKGIRRGKFMRPPSMSCR